MKREFTFFKENLQGKITVHKKTFFLNYYPFFGFEFYVVFNGTVKVDTPTIPEHYEFQYVSESYPELDQALLCLKEKIDSAITNLNSFLSNC